MRFPYYKQQDQKDCGPTCLQIICKYYGKTLPIQKLRNLCRIDREGVNLLGISEAAEKLCFQTNGVMIGMNQLNNAELPCILHWNQNHFVVLYKVKKNKYFIADPSTGLIILNENQMVSKWISQSKNSSGIALLLNPTPSFFDQNYDNPSKVSWRYIFRYFYKYKKLFIQLMFGMLVGTILSLVTPFLTQSIVDVGINTKDINFVYLILIAQVMLFIGSTSINFIRSWVLLHISTRVNLSILTDFLIKLMKLPLSFFETKTTGDIMQRMNDQRTIENFLTVTSLSTLFSFINLLVFTVVLIHYHLLIFAVSMFFTLVYAGWIMLFFNRRRELNYKQFANSSDNQSNIVELVNGMQEIKLNNCEQKKRWGWESIQAKLFRYKVQMLSLTQTQEGGSMFINQSKNILITFLSVKAVIDGQITLGGMMAIQYIVGQVTNPIERLLGFMQSYQDAKISLERLNEIHQLTDEEHTEKEWLTELPNDKTITIRNLRFTYFGAGNEPVLQNIDLIIPQGKTTAIVGMSGSGKTTLLKLLLRFYEIEDGEISIGLQKLNHFSYKTWRKACGTVLQDGFIFSDTIANNIAVGDDSPDEQKLQHALKVANINEYIAELPFGLNTKIGATGNGLSQGQKQRLLIARAVYKDPEYLFFDEATNALDANNERVIMNNLIEFCTGRTVIVVAHRLSTVSRADNIIMLKKGRILEQGTHQQLIAMKGDYYELVKDQIALGN